VSRNTADGMLAIGPEPAHLELEVAARTGTFDVSVWSRRMVMIEMRRCRSSSPTRGHSARQFAPGNHGNDVRGREYSLARRGCQDGYTGGRMFISAIVQASAPGNGS